MPLPEYLNNELVRRLREDDKEAFNNIFWKYHAAIYNNILRITKEAAVAEDIVQEVFISLWEQREKLDPEKEVSGWLFVVSYNKSVDYLKQKQKESIVRKKVSQSAELPVEEDAELLNVRMNLLEKAIDQLSPQKKRVFELCKLKRKTYEEAAEEMKLSKHTVKEYLSGALNSIREFVKQYPESTAVIIFSIALGKYI